MGSAYIQLGRFRKLGYVGGGGGGHTDAYVHIYIYQWRRKVPKSGGAHRYVIYVPSVKNQYKRVVFGYMVIY